MSPTEDFEQKGKTTNRTQLIFRVILILNLICVAALFPVSISFFHSSTDSILAMSNSQISLKAAVDDLKEQSKQRSKEQSDALAQQKSQLDVFTSEGEKRQIKNEELVASSVAFIQQARNFIQDMKEAFSGFTTTITNDLESAKKDRQDLMNQMRGVTRAARSSEDTSRITRHKVEQRLPPNPTPKPWFHFP